MPLKQIIALGTYHEVQHSGHMLNAKFAGVISLIRESYGAQIILEEWLYSEEHSFASTLSTPDLEWKNVGTSNETRFETFTGGLNCHPPTYDPAKPILQPEYGPLAAQERRESYMVDRIGIFMEPYHAGLFIVGIAHLHSILCKLKVAGFDARGYCWIDQK
jgi:hypothetical protein